MSNHDRDPMSNLTTGRAIAVWLASSVSDEEADIALEEMLIQQGILTPDDIIEEFLPERNAVSVRLATGEKLLVSTDGIVTQLFPPAE